VRWLTQLLFVGAAVQHSLSVKQVTLPAAKRPYFISMKNMPQRPPAGEPDTALLVVGSLFETLHHSPERDDAKLDALAMHILDEGPKTLLGLVVKARAEKWLRRRLWMLAFDSLSPSDQGACVVIDSAMRIDWRHGLLYQG
jgi:hypothetical protein